MYVNSEFKEIEQVINLYLEGLYERKFHLLEKAFSGSAEKLVMRALSAKKVSAKELAKIRQMLDEMEGK